MRGDHFLNIAIIDDVEEDSTTLCGYLKKYCKENKILVKIKSFRHGNDFLASFLPHVYDIVFLDIYMQDINGMDIAKKIRETDESCLLVFFTKSTDCNHALGGYKVGASDYLIKPLGYDVLANTMERCDRLLAKKSRDIRVKEGRSYIKILVCDILFTDYSNHYVYIHTKKGTVKTYMRFIDFSDLLKEYPQFVCNSRNCLVNLDEVSEMSGNEFTMHSGDLVAISATKRTKILEYYYNYQFEKLDRLY